MTDKPAVTLRLSLADQEGLGRIVVDMEAFFEFSFWMAEELEDLVAKWSHFAPPASDPLRDASRRRLDR